MRFLIEDLTVGKFVLAFCVWNGLKFMVVELVVCLVPYLSFCFHPFFRIVTKDGFLLNLLVCPFLFFSLG